MNAADAVYGFAAWLSSRKETTILGGMIECSDVAILVDMFCKENEIVPSGFITFKAPETTTLFPKNLLKTNIDDLVHDNSECSEQREPMKEKLGNTNGLKKLDPKVRTKVQTEVETIVARELGGKEKGDVVWDPYLGKFVPKEQSEPKDIMLVSITTSFSAVHRWSECPIEDVAFLRKPHRHVFHVKMKFPVYHDDRDIEFIDMKNKVEAFIAERWDKKDLGDMSCEMMCKALALRFKAVVVGVYEDNENGAELIREI